MKEVKVLITGPACSGKTTVAVVIEKALKDAGFGVAPFTTEDGDEVSKRLWYATGALKPFMSEINVGIEEKCVRNIL